MKHKLLKKFFLMFNILSPSKIIETTLRYHLTPVRMNNIYKTNAIHDDEDVEKREYFMAGGSASMYSHHGNQCRRISK